MTEFWDKPAEKSGKVLEEFLEGLPLPYTPVKSKAKGINSLEEYFEKA